MFSKFDLDKKYAESQMLLNKMKQSEGEMIKQFKLMTRKFEAKKDECESLTFRVKHLEDLANMMEPPLSSQSLSEPVNGESDPAQIDTGAPG